MEKENGIRDTVSQKVFDMFRDNGFVIDELFQERNEFGFKNDFKVKGRHLSFFAKVSFCSEAPEAYFSSIEAKYFYQSHILTTQEVEKAYRVIQEVVDFLIIEWQQYCDRKRLIALIVTA